MANETLETREVDPDTYLVINLNKDPAGIAAVLAYSRFLCKYDIEKAKEAFNQASSMRKEVISAYKNRLCPMFYDDCALKAMDKLFSLTISLITDMEEEKRNSDDARYGMGC